ncbi:MAG TPA: aminopeptidase P family protein [Mycobacteriales bacterium]|nr:aminopeptidase P family protein [Mycobacteriales bacterium]
MSEQPNGAGSQRAGRSEDGTQPHDAEVPEVLMTYMGQGWLPAPDGSGVPTQRVAPYAAKRRALLSARFPGDVLVVPTGGLVVRANDTDYPFRAGSDYFWLVGDLEPDGVLVMTPEGEGHAATVYVPARSDRASGKFFTDRRYGELWVGPRWGVDEVAKAYDVATADLETLPDVLAAHPGARVRRGEDPRVEAMVADRTDERDAELATALSELRLCKDDLEVTYLEEACAATATGFSECVREIATAQQLANGERWLEGTFWRRARVDGNDVGYGSIVACGDHATTLHWTRDDGPIRDGDLMLLDMGIESRNLYTADITRTLPVNGRFSPAQRQVYEVVWKAQRAAIAATKPGADFLEPHRVAMRIITEALISWGVIEGELEQVLKDQLHRRFTLHSTSHHLGIDVHDCAKARNEFLRGGTLAPGMVITIEPGLYFQRDDTFAPEELRGIGVRIEDDVLVTDDSCRVLSDALPTEAGEVEAWMRSLL